MAYMYCNSLSMSVHHCYPKADLSKLFTLDVIDKAHEGKYDADTQSSVTQEDIAMQMEVNNDRDDDSLEWGDFTQLRQIDDDDSAATPVVELRNPRLFDLSGEAESVSTIGNSVSSVQFQEDDFVTDNEKDVASANSIKSNKPTLPPRPNEHVLRPLKQATNKRLLTWPLYVVKYHPLFPS